MTDLLRPILPIAWTLLWVFGGWLLAGTAFRLRRAEVAMVGLGIGMVLEVWLANLLAQVLPVLVSFWVSSTLVFVFGLTAAVYRGGQFRVKIPLAHGLLLGALVILFNAIGRGLGIFDDYQNLPTVSLIATGDLPPKFALNPSLRFGYHHFLLLFAAEVMQLGSMFPWSALDLARAFCLALPLVLAALWGYRMTGNLLAGFLTSCMLAFSGGARWLLLLLPTSWLTRISDQITLIGSAATSAPSLAQAMLSTWKIDGAGPIPFPFAFYSGVNQPYIMWFTGIAGSGVLIMLLLLLTAERWRHWSAGIITTVLFSALAFANEIAFLLVGFGFLVSFTIWLAFTRSRGSRTTGYPVKWLLIITAALLIAIVQGGMLTELARALLAGEVGVNSYFDTSPIFIWPPAIVSAHLGSLSVINPNQLASALLEIGPGILVTPLVLAWGWKSLRLGKWYEASFVGTMLGALLAIFITFKGPLFSATPRLMGGWFLLSALYAVPLCWIWMRYRNGQWKIGAVAGGIVSSLGGVVLFGILLIAIQKPTYATFISPMDAKMSQEYWNKLKPGAWIFDPVVFRGPTVFGRYTVSSPSWYTRTADWQMLNDSPNPFRLRAAGFQYLYFDSDYWESIGPEQQAMFKVPCVKQIAQVDGIHGEDDYTKDFRRLLEIDLCQ